MPDKIALKKYTFCMPYHEQGEDGLADEVVDHAEEQAGEHARQLREDLVAGAHSTVRYVI